MFLVALCISTTMLAEGYDYCTLNGKKSTTLLNAVYDLIEDHTVLTYAQCRADNAQVDLDANNNVMDMYSNCEFKKWNYCKDIDQEECTCHNREHMLPKSWWGGSTEEPMYTDLHHVIPTDYVANTNRSAWIYDEVKNTPSWTNGVSKLGTSTNFSGETAFEPADEYKGDVARVYFYMITCYKDKSFTAGGKGWKYFNTGTATLKTTALNLLLKWHRNDPVSQKEITRNDKVEKKQGNRNPFVDEPSLVEHIWGNKKNTNYTCAATDVEVTEQAEIYPKIMKNGRLYIQVGDQLYDVLGRNVTE